jgi:hypothetical protein
VLLAVVLDEMKLKFQLIQQAEQFSDKINCVIQINHQPNATIFQFIILRFV